MKLSKITDVKGRITWCGTAKELQESLADSNGPVIYESIEAKGPSGVAALLNDYEQRKKP